MKRKIKQKERDWIEIARCPVMDEISIEREKREI